jgi:hypothetical protein
MADKVETIVLLPHPIDFETKKELTAQDSRTEGNVQGQDVWKLVAQVPWSQYPVNWLTYPRSDSTKPVIGTYQVELNRGNLMRNKTPGSSNDWDYYWNAISWKLLGEQPTPAPNSNGGQPAAPRILGTGEVNKTRSMALSYAKDAWCAGKIERGELMELAGLFQDAIENGFYETEEE